MQIPKLEWACLPGATIALMCLVWPLVSAAETRIAILDFELNDLTLNPGTREELKRTASIAPLLRDAIIRKKGYQLVSIDGEEQAKANAGFGYLFEHPDVAAKLGSQFGADWVVVGRLHKPSFLFAYLKVRLVNVTRNKIEGDYVVEIKGYLKALAERGTAQLSDQIDQTIRQIEGSTLP